MGDLRRGAREVGVRRAWWFFVWGLAFQGRIRDFGVKGGRGIYGLIDGMVVLMMECVRRAWWMVGGGKHQLELDLPYSAPRR